MKLSDTLNAYGSTIKLICLALISLLLVYLGHWMTDNHWQAKYDQHLSADSKANEKAATEALTKQQELLQELEHAYKTAETLTRQHKINVANAADSERRLRAELDRIKAMPAVTHTSTLSERAAEATNRIVLAELLGISDHQSGIYAEEADRLRIALEQCNSEYEAVRLTINTR